MTIGEPVEDFLTRSKKENARNQLAVATNLFNEAVRVAKAEGLFVIISLNKEEALDVKALLSDEGDDNE